MRKLISAAIVIMGFSGLLAEILLLRELMIVFSGNELCIGIILANWLILEAAGCYASTKIPNRPKTNLLAFLLATVLFSVALVGALLLARAARTFLGVSVGQSIGLLTIFYSSFMILLPVSLPHGALFTLACRISTRPSDADSASTGKVYVHETVGTMAGGIFCTFLFLTQINSIAVTTALAAVNLATCLMLSRHCLLRENKTTLRFIQTALASLLVCTLALILTGQTKRLHDFSVRYQWRSQNVVHYQNSQYANICVVENEGQYIYFVDGLPRIMVPIPDIPAVEEFVHLPLLAHPNPREIAILSGGAGGVISEILKHPSITSVHYAEIDPLLTRLMQQFETELTQSELSDPRVELKNIDGRLLLKLAPDTYDVIFVGVDEPSSLQANRYFTLEFFKLAAQRLKTDGVFAIALPGSMALLNDEIKNLNSCIYNTMIDVFRHVRVIPGEESNYFFASQSVLISDMDARHVATSIQDRDISTDMLLPRNIENKLHEGWKRWFADLIDGGTTRLNRDFRPLGLFYNIAHWNSLYAPAFGRMFKTFERINLGAIAGAIAAMTVVLILLRCKLKKFSSVPFSIGSTGFAGMLLDLVVIFAFQAIYGYVFSWIGLLVALFMAGAAAGAVFTNSFITDTEKPRKVFIAIELAIVAYSVLLPFLFFTVNVQAESALALEFARVAFLAASTLSGFLIGAQFPVANRLHGNEARDASGTAGLLYAADLIGGWLGGILGAVMLLPILGLAGTCAAIAILKIASLIVFATQSVGSQ